MKVLFSKLINIVSFVLIFISCNSKKPVNTVVDDAVVIRMQPVVTTNYITAKQYSGKIESSSQANLSFKIGGIVSRIYVKEGDAVKRGQLLATLNLTEINAQVQQAAQAAEKANRDYARVKNLLSRYGRYAGAVSKCRNRAKSGR